MVSTFDCGKVQFFFAESPLISQRNVQQIYQSSNWIGMIHRLGFQEIPHGSTTIFGMMTGLNFG